MRLILSHATCAVCLLAANVANAQTDFSVFDPAETPTDPGFVDPFATGNTDPFNTGFQQPTDAGQATDFNNGATDFNNGATDFNNGATDVNGGATDVNGGATDVNGGGTDVNGGATDVNGGGTDVDGGATDATGTDGATATDAPFPPTFTTPSLGIPDITPTNPPNDPNLWPQVPASFDMWCEEYVNYKGINCYNGPRPDRKCNILYGNQNTDDPTPGCTPDRCCRSAKVRIPCKDSPYVTCTDKDLKATRKCVKTAQPINNKEACGNLRCCSNRPRPTDCYTWLTKNALECGIISPGLGWQSILQNKACWDSPRGTECTLDYCCGELENAIESLIGGQR